jgi:hypothetical protein
MGRPLQQCLFNLLKMKNKFVFLILVFCVGIVYSQTNDTIINNKYLSALIYLKTNESIANRMSIFYKKWGKNKENKKKEIIDFNVSKYIKFLPIHYFKQEGGLDTKSYHKKYYFKYKENLFFEKIIPRTKTELFLVFSKPIDNYLVAELVINDSGFEIDLVDNVTGPVMQLMFIFDDNNIIIDVFIYSSYVN